MAHVFWPDTARLEAKGYASVAHVPCIFGANWRYQPEASRYLRERALAEWSFSPQSEHGSLHNKYLTPKSLGAIANALINFLEWCDRRGKDWRLLSYTEDLIRGYQAQMLTGAWSVHGSALKGSTVNQRVSHACNFLCWAADRELRCAFDIITSTVHVRTDSGTQVHRQRTRQVQARVGAVRQDPASLRIPTDQEVIRWLESVRVERGTTKALMCELVLATGIRREELVQWRIDTLPFDRSEWAVIGDQVEVTIKYGTKGPKYPGADGDEGPPRKIAMPLSVAERLHAYREFARPKARAQYVRNAPSREDRSSRQRRRVKQLFLSDATGEPFSPQVFYEAWTSASALPYKGWSPHTGRNYWACKILLVALERRDKTLKINQSHASSGWISDSVADILSLVIRPQLGHFSVETSNRYLVWVERAFTLTSLHGQYEMNLDALLESSVESNV